MSNEDSLASRVLKSCYFPEASFLNAECKPTASFVWKSLMWGKEIISAGSRWRVGNGAKIRIYKDQWILRPSTFSHLSPHVLGEIDMVD